jgi:hypothetical protein
LENDPSLRSAIARPPPCPARLNGSISAARAYRAQFAEERRLRPARSLERQRRAGGVQSAQCGAPHLRGADADTGTARSGDAQLATLLDQQEHDAGVKQR